LESTIETKTKNETELQEVFSQTVLVFFFTLVLFFRAFAQAQYGWLQRAGFPGPARHALLLRQ